MPTKHDEKVEELKGLIAETEAAEVDFLEDAMKRKWRLSDAIRDGARVAPQANGWGDGSTMCALHAAVTSAEARGIEL